MHPRLVPYRVLLSDMPSASRLRRVGYIVRRASDHFLVACLRSLRLKVQPVCLMLIISNNHHCDFVSRYPFAFLSGCPGASLVLAVRFPLSGESYVVYATASNSPRSHARSSRFTSGTPCRRETISKYGQDSRLLAKLLRTASQFLNLVPRIYQNNPW
jgi:hypothetical protein